jgi:altronate dehydratase
MIAGQSFATGARGFPRADGGFGIRNHLLVLPSVVCATHTAREIAADTRAVAITHQHGCLHVGDDLAHTEAVLMGAALNPNVGAVIVVGLGCETLQGFRFARRLGERRGGVEFVGIQLAGGTAAAVQRGRAIVQQRLAELEACEAVPVPADRLAVGIDAGGDPLAEPLAAELRARGAGAILADGLSGGAAHVQLAGRGAHLIVSLCAADQAPLGFAVAPVVAVARDADTYQALADDFDIGAGEEAGSAAAIADRVFAAAAGAPTAAELRGSVDFVLNRQAVTM